jgi:hypothetical protein
MTAALRAQAAGAGRDRGEDRGVHPLGDAFRPPQRVVARLGQLVEAVGGGGDAAVGFQA